MKSIGRNTMAIPAIALALCLLYIFGDAFFTARTLYSGDGPPLYEKGRSALFRLANCIGTWRTDHIGLGEGKGGTTFHPLLLSYAWSVKFHGTRYIGATIVTFLGMAYYLRGLGVCRLAAGTAGLAFALSGYSFTLVMAGHHGFFNLTAYAIFALGFIHRAVVRGSFWHYAATGAFMVYMVASQPDFAAPLFLLFAVYGFVIFFRELIIRRRAKRKGPIIRLINGTELAILVFALMGIGAFRFMFETVVPGRQVQHQRSAEDRYIFASNWSFPPEEMLEFVAPCVFGTSSNSEDRPYWGRIGQSHGWERFRQGYMNARSHSVYLGVMQLVLALYAVSWLWPGRAPPGEKRPKVDYRPWETDFRPFIRFWLIVAVIGLFLCFGRYSFAYKLFYAIPFMDMLRAPIKFLRFVELGTCILMGIGFHMLLEQVKHARAKAAGLQAHGWINGFATLERLYGRQTMFAAIGAGAMLAAIGYVAVTGDHLFDTWYSLGLSHFENDLTRQMYGAFANSLVLFAFATALFGYARRYHRSPVFAWIVAAGIPLTIAWDMGRLGREFAYTRDLSDMYAPNSIAARMVAADPHARLKDVFTDRKRLNPLAFNWKANGCVLLGPSADKPVEVKFLKFSRRFNDDPIRLYRLTSTRFAIVDRGGLPILNPDEYTEIASFRVENNRYVEMPPGEGPNVAIEIKDVLPRAAVYHQWAGTGTEGGAMSILLDPDTDLRTPLVRNLRMGPAGSGRADVSPCTITKLTVNRMRCETSITKPGVLYTTDRWHPNTEVRVNGKRAALLECNVTMRGVYLPAGNHVVEFIYEPYKMPTLINMGTTLALALLAIVPAIRRRRKARTA